MNRIYFYIVLFGLAVLATAGVWGLESGESLFEGKVRDALTKQPVANADVVLYDDVGNIQEGKTDSSGNFKITWSEEWGAPFAAVGADDYVYRELALSDLSETGEILLVPETVFSGRLEFAGENIPRAEVTLFHASTYVYGRHTKEDDSTQAANLPVDRFGRFRAPKLKPGAYRVVAEASGYVTQYISRIVYLPDELTPALLKLREAAFIMGSVLNPEGQPLKGVQVYPLFKKSHKSSDSDKKKSSSIRYSRRKAETNKSGVFSLDGIPSWKECALLFIHPDFAPQIITTDFSTNGVMLEPVMLAPGGEVAGTVFDKETGMPIEGAEITSPLSYDRDNFRFYGRYENGGTSDAEGNFALNHLSPAEHSVKAEARGFAPEKHGDIHVEEGETTEGVEMALIPGYFIEGTVMDNQGTPLAEATVDAQPQSPSAIGAGASLLQATTDKDGSYELVALSQPKVRLEVSAQGFSNAKAMVDAERVERQDFTLQPSGGISGYVRMAGDGSPVQEFQIRCDHKPFEETTENIFHYDANARRLVVNESGQFELDNLRAGKYTFTFRAKGLAPRILDEMDIYEGEWVRGLDVELEKGLQIEGRVLSASSRSPVEGAKVEAARKYSEDSSSETDRDGHFVLDGLYPGVYKISADHPDFAETKISGIELVDGGEIPEVELLLSDGGRIRIRILDSEGNPFTGRAMFALIGQGRVSSAAFDKTGPGVYESKNEPPGSYTVMMIGEINANKAVEVISGETKEVVFDFRGITLRGQALYRGRPFQDYIHVTPVETSNFVISRSLDSGGSISSMKTGKPDASGMYSVSGLQAGRFKITTAEGSYKAEIDIPDQPEFVHNIKIPGGEVHGQVIDRETGEGVLEAKLSLKPVDDGDIIIPGWKLRASGPGGVFSLSYIKAGTYRVLAEKNGVEGFSEAPVEVAEDQRVDGVVIYLEQGRAGLEGRVTTTSGAPLNADLLMQYGEQEYWRWKGRTDDNGEFLWKNLQAGECRLVATAEGMANRMLSLVLRDEETAQAEIVMELGGGLRLWVKDASGQPYENAKVRVFNPKGEELPPRLTTRYMLMVTVLGNTDKNGYTTMTGLSEGPHRLVVEDEEAGLKSEANVDIVAGEIQELTMTL